MQVALISKMLNSPSPYLNIFYVKNVSNKTFGTFVDIRVLKNRAFETTMHLK